MHHYKNLNTELVTYLIMPRMSPDSAKNHFQGAPLPHFLLLIRRRALAWNRLPESLVAAARSLALCQKRTGTHTSSGGAERRGKKEDLSAFLSTTVCVLIGDASSIRQLTPEGLRTHSASASLHNQVNLPIRTSWLMASGLNQIALGRARSRGVNAASPALISNPPDRESVPRQTPAAAATAPTQQQNSQFGCWLMRRCENQHFRFRTLSQTLVRVRMRSAWKRRRSSCVQTGSFSCSGERSISTMRLALCYCGLVWASGFAEAPPSTRADAAARQQKANFILASQLFPYCKSPSFFQHGEFPLNLKAEQ